MSWKSGVRLSAILIICGVVIIVIAKKWKKIYNPISEYSQSIQHSAGIYKPICNSMSDLLQESSYTSDDVSNYLSDDALSPEEDELTLNSQDTFKGDYKPDSSVPEYVEEMNDYLNEGEQLGSTIADVYDNLTRAPDISEGKSLQFVSEAGICASDPWTESGHAPV